MLGNWGFDWKCGLRYVREGVDLEFVSSSFMRPIQFLPRHAKLVRIYCKLRHVSIKGSKISNSYLEVQELL